MQSRDTDLQQPYPSVTSHISQQAAATEIPHYADLRLKVPLRTSDSQPGNAQGLLQAELPVAVGNLPSAFEEPAGKPSPAGTANFQLQLPKQDSTELIKSEQQPYMGVGPPEQGVEQTLGFQKEESSPSAHFVTTPEQSEAAVRPCESDLVISRQNSSVELAKAALEDMIHCSKPQPPLGNRLLISLVSFTCQCNSVSDWNKLPCNAGHWKSAALVGTFNKMLGRFTTFKQQACTYLCPTQVYPYAATICQVAYSLSSFQP